MLRLRFWSLLFLVISPHIIGKEPTLIYLPNYMANWTNQDRDDLGDQMIWSFHKTYPNDFQYKYVPLKRAVVALQRGDVHCYFGADSETLQRFAGIPGMHSKAVKIIKWRYVTADSNPVITGYAQLKEKRVGKLGAIPNDKFVFNVDPEHIGQIEQLNSEELIINMLLRGRIDVGLISDQAADIHPRLHYSKSVGGYRVERALVCAEGFKEGKRIIDLFNTFLSERDGI